MISMQTPNTPSMPIQQKGYTLVELAIAVAILAVLIVAGLTGVQGILTSGKVNDQIKVVAKLNSKISSLYASNVSGTQALTPAATGTKEVANLGGWDSGRVSSTGTVTSAFGSSETVQTNVNKIGDITAKQGVVYGIRSVPQAGCADLANGINSLVYSMIVVAASSITAPDTNETDWTTTGSKAVKTPGSTSLATSTLATQCATSSTLDFWVLLKP
jgi:prepilin-type N-terminal cleavage/methylation domain-containing protein